MMRLLIAADFSPESRNALETVQSHLNRTGVEAHICLLHAYTIPLQKSLDDIIAAHDALRSLSLTGLEREKAAILAKLVNPRVSVSTISQMGSLQNVIDSVAEAWDIDCIVIGVRADVFSKKDEGRVLTEITSRADRPLAVVPSGYAYANPGKIGLVGESHAKAIMDPLLKTLGGNCEILPYRVTDAEPLPFPVFFIKG